jgi:sugar lactone lactonase YvrE
LNTPTGVSIDPTTGDLLIGDRMNGRVRRVVAATSTMGASVETGQTPYLADSERPRGKRYPIHTAVASNGDIYYSEWRGHRVMKINPATKVISVVAGTGEAGYSGDGGPAVAAKLDSPWGLALDEQGNLYVSTIGRVRKITSNGVVTTIAGCCDIASPPALIADGSLATAVKLNGGNSALAYRNGKLFLHDSGSALQFQSVLEIDLGRGTIRRAAGNGSTGQAVLFGSALSTPLGQLSGLAVDAAGDVFVADFSSNSISRVRTSDGEFRLIAGGRQGFAGDGGSATAAALNLPQGLAVDRRGNLYFADRSNQRVRVVMCAGQPEVGEVSDCDPAAATRPNRRVLVQWNQLGVTQCEAVGSWSGARANAGTEWLPIGMVGSQSYGLLCTGTDGSVSLSETEINGLTVTEKPRLGAHLNDRSVSFGTVRVGESSATRKLILTNTGLAPLPLDSISVAGEGAASFSVTGNCGSTLAVTAICEIEVVFRPQSSGEKSAELVVGSGALRLTAALTGTADAPPPASGIVVDAIDVNFGSLRVGSASAPRFVRLRNIGQTSATVALSVTGIASNEINLNSACGASLGAGADCEIALVLQPTSVGFKTGQLVVGTATGQSSVALRGRVGQSENQFICRATPEQTEPAPRSSVLDVVVSGVPNEPNFIMEYTPVPDATSYQLELKWESGGLNYSYFTIPYPNLAYCPRLSFAVTPSSSGSLGYSYSGSDSCLIKITGPAVIGQTKPTVRLTAAGRSASDSIVLGAVRTAAPIVTASAQNGLVALGWIPVPAATDYVVYRLDGSSAVQVTTTSGTGVSLPGLTLGTPYTYAVKSRSSAGLSAFSAPVTLTPRVATSTSIVVEDIRVNQAVEVTAGSSTKLIAGKPGIVEVYLNVTGDEIGMPGIVRLQAPGIDPIEIFGPLLHTPTSVGAGAACVATFDLRDEASTWFAAGTRNVTAEVEVLGRPSTSPAATTSKAFSFVEERPLYVKLIPVNSIRGNPTAAEIELAKTSIEKQLRAMYPNRNPQIVLSNSAYQFSGTNAGSTFLNELLPVIDLLRSAELSNVNCDRFYYALHKDNASLGSRTVGLAYVPNAASLGSCPRLSGVGVIEFPLTVDTTAHEIGHNHGRSHVGSIGETNDSCGAPSNADASYPYDKGRIGVTGYDSAAHRSLSKNLFHDIMGYCNRNWISDYQYRALRGFQDALAVLPKAASARMVGGAGGTLLSGSVDSFGVWKLGARLPLGGSRSADLAAARGFTAVAMLTDGARDH